MYFCSGKPMRLCTGSCATPSKRVEGQYRRSVLARARRQRLVRLRPIDGTQRAPFLGAQSDAAGPHRRFRVAPHRVAERGIALPAVEQDFYARLAHALLQVKGLVATGGQPPYL